MRNEYLHEIKYQDSIYEKERMRERDPDLGF